MKENTAFGPQKNALKTNNNTENWSKRMKIKWEKKENDRATKAAIEQDGQRESQKKDSGLHKRTNKS